MQPIASAPMPSTCTGRGICPKFVTGSRGFLQERVPPPVVIQERVQAARLPGSDGAHLPVAEAKDSSV
jgi:hypothetical protein